MNKKVIFIHIPKTGGVSIGDALLQTSWFKLTEPRHLTAATLKERMGAETFNNNFIFTMVRNPWDRLVSAYYFLQFGATDIGLHAHSASEAFKKLAFSSFENFIERLYNDNKNEQNIYWAKDKTISANLHTKKQVNWVFSKDGECLINYIGRFHRFKESLKELTSICGQTELKYKEINTTTHPPYQELYTPETISMVAELYQDDIKAFNFTFNNEE